MANIRTGTIASESRSGRCEVIRGAVLRDLLAAHNLRREFDGDWIHDNAKFVTVNADDLIRLLTGVARVREYVSPNSDRDDEPVQGEIGMNNEIRSALTPEEWAQEIQHGDVEPRGRHAEAALALYGQPFGFTKEDVWALEVTVLQMQNETPDDGAQPWIDRFRSLAARITALLPPE